MSKLLNFLSVFLSFPFVLFCFLLFAAWAPPYLFLCENGQFICKKTYKHEIENLDDFVQGEVDAGTHSVSHEVSVCLANFCITKKDADYGVILRPLLLLLYEFFV